MRLPKIPFLAALGILAVGCHQESVDDVLAEMKSAAFTQSIEAGNHKINVQFIPKEFQLLLRSRLNGSTIVTSRLLDSLELIEGMQKGMTFIMRLSPIDSTRGNGFEKDVVYGNISGYGNYQQALQAYTFGLKEKIWLEINDQKYPLSNYQMENSFGMTQSRTFTLLFPGPKETFGTKQIHLKLVLDDIVPGLNRKKIDWVLPVRKYEAI